MSFALPASAAPGEPWPHEPSLSSSFDLEYEIAAGVQPFADAVIDWGDLYGYDEECWDQLHEVQAPEVESDPLSINGPFMLDFEYEPVEYLADPLKPASGAYLDTRFWESAARDQFLGCLPTVKEARKHLYELDPETEPFAAEDCFSEVVADFGSPCMPIEESQCMDTSFHDSWCGRAEYDQKGDDEEWLCNVVVGGAADVVWFEAESTTDPILVPERTVGPDGTRRHYLERDHGVVIETEFAHTAYDADVFAAPADAESAMLAAQSERANWAANGGVFSCAEYADEATKSFSDIEAFSRLNSRRSRAVFDRAFSGPNPIIQQASSYPTTRWNVTDALGGRMRDAPGEWTGLSTCGDDGMVPWAMYPSPGGTVPVYELLSNPESGAYRLFPRQHGSCQAGAFTFKNVYYFLHQLRKGPSEDFQVHDGFDRCQGWADSNKIHYRVNAGWHKRMAEATLAADYTDAELDYLAHKQSELLELYSDFVAETDPDVRESMTHQIDWALAEGARMGCIPDDPDELTPCDWAPSYFAEGSMKLLSDHRERLETECIEEFGEGPLGNAMLRARFLDPAMLDEILNPPCSPGSTHHCPHYLWDDINDMYQENATCPGGGTACSAVDYTADHNGIERNIDHYGEYMNLIKDALSSSTVRPGILYDEVERSYGNGLFGGSLRAGEQLDMIGEQPEYATSYHALTDSACGVFPNAEAETELDLEIFGLPAGKLHAVNQEVAKTDLAVDENWMSTDTTNPFEGHFGYDAGFTVMLDDDAIGVCADQSVAYFLPVPDFPGFEYPYVTPFVTIWLRAGIKGTLKVAFGQQACWGHSIADVDPSEVEAAAANGIAACPDKITLSASLTPSAGIGAWAEVGVADNFSALEVGARVDITMASLSLPMTAGVVTDVSSTIGAEPFFSFTPKLTLMKGALSVYVKLVKFVKIFQYTLLEFGGINFKKAYEDFEWRDVCVFVEAEALGSGTKCAVEGCGGNLCNCTEDSCDFL